MIAPISPAQKTDVKARLNGHKPELKREPDYGPVPVAHQALEAEEAVLGCILIDPEIYRDVAHILKAGDFYLHKHQWIWNAIVRLNEQGTPSDSLTLTDELERVNQLSEAGGTAYLARLITSVPTSLHAEAYARLVERQATRRRLLNAAESIAKLAMTEDRNIDDVIQEATATLTAVAERGPAKNKFAGLVVSAVEVATKEPRPTDWLTHKFIERGELVLITAPGGTMKSLLMLDWAVSIASGVPWLGQAKGVGLSCQFSPVLWVNTDNGQKTHENRLDAIRRARGLDVTPVFSLTTTELELTKREHSRNLAELADMYGATVIVIDTLSGALTGVNENSAEEMTLPASNLRALADCGLTVVCLHHPPKNDANGSRGSSVLPNKVDRIYSLARTGDLLTVTWQKIRNTPTPSRRILAGVENDLNTDALVAVRFFEGESAQQDAADDVLRKKVLEALGGEQAGLNTRSLKAKCKCRWEDLKRVLGGLRLNGVIEETKGPKNASIYRLSVE